VGRVAIAGVGESRFGSVPDATSWQLAREAGAVALAEGGCGRGDVYGLFACGNDLMHPVLLAEYLGIRPSYVDGTNVGGASWELFVHHAIGAVAAGRCKVALLT